MKRSSLPTPEAPREPVTVAENHDPVYIGHVVHTAIRVIHQHGAPVNVHELRMRMAYLGIAEVDVDQWVIRNATTFTYHDGHVDAKGRRTQ